MLVEIFHDTACPWCRIGKRHLQQALETWTGEPVSIIYRAFQLNADIPEGGYDFREYMHAKGGGQIPLEQFFAGPRDTGARAGLTFNFEAITRAPNTIRTHQLIAIALEEKRAALVDAFYEAYFEHGRNIGDPDVIRDIAAEQGIDPVLAESVLSDNAGRAEVMDDLALARQIGVTGVPFFVINRRLAFSGAQPPQLIHQALQQALDLQTTEQPGA